MNASDKPLSTYFGYIGSKSSMADELIQRMPSEAFESYCEVFAGGLGLFLKKPKAKVNIVNDLDSDLIEMHATVAAQPEAVMAELAKLRPCRSVFDRLRHLRDTAEWHDLSAPERAAVFLYVAKCSVNGNLQSFSNSSKTTSNFNPRFDLRPYSAKFEGVTFENLHWRELLHRLVFKPPMATVFLYLDPPYVVADSRKHYRLNFDPVEHLMLAHTLARINVLNNGDTHNVKVMLSYDDDPDGYVRSLYRPEFGWHVTTIATRYIAEHRASRGTEELLITNYDPRGLAVSQASAEGIDVAVEPSPRLGIASAEVQGVKR
jgi:DNA adenine methylase